MASPNPSNPHEPSEHREAVADTPSAIQTYRPPDLPVPLTGKSLLQLMALAWIFIYLVFFIHGINGATGFDQPTSKTNLPAMIDLNNADVADLSLLPGIGPAKAEAIIEYRRLNGPFQKLEDLTAVSGIGAKTITNISQWVYCSEPGADRQQETNNLEPAQ